jgi:cytochrome c oxidase subunit 2
MSRWSRSLAVAASVGAVLVLALPALAQQPTPGSIDLQPSATPVMADVRWFHHGILMPIITAVTLFVLALLAWCAIRFNAKANPTPSRTTHHVGLEIAWTVVPVLILVVIAIPSFQLLYRQQIIPAADMTVKITGSAWYWNYAYPDHGNFEFRSLMLRDDNETDPTRNVSANAARAQAAQQLGRPIGEMPRLLAVDNEMVVPVNRTVRIQVTASDVMHSFALPSFGVKVDAIPGRLNEGWFRAERPGLYYGQCSELCGRDHAFMPIAIRVVSEQDFAAWVEDARRRFAGDPPPARVAALPATR